MRFIGWKVYKQPSHEDFLSVKINGVLKNETPASLVFRLFDHILLFPNGYVDFNEKDKREFLLNDKPIPDWIKPIIVPIF